MKRHSVRRIQAEGNPLHNTKNLSIDVLKWLIHEDNRFKLELRRMAFIAARRAGSAATMRFMRYAWKADYRLQIPWVILNHR